MKTAMITGPSRGLGKSLAIELTRRGYGVIATARNLGDLESLDVYKKFPLDVTAEKQIRELAREIGTVDVLINNAAYSVGGPLEAIPVEEVRKEYETNVIGPLRLIKAFLPGMREANKGTIVNISSVADRFAPPYGGSYSSAKAALAMMSEALRFELRHFGIRVILVEAGAIKTDFALNQKQFSSAPYHDLSEQMRSRFEDYLEGGKRNSPDDIARIVADSIETPDPFFRVPAGKDAEYMISQRSQLSDVEWERSPLYSSLNW